MPQSIPALAPECQSLKYLGHSCCHLALLTQSLHHHDWVVEILSSHTT